jgi:hypothetical protein
MSLLTRFVGYTVLTGALAFGAATVYGGVSAKEVERKFTEEVVPGFVEAISGKDKEIKDLRDDFSGAASKLEEFASMEYLPHLHSGSFCIEEKATGNHYKFARDSRNNLHFTGATLADELERLHEDFAPAEFTNAYQEIEARKRLDKLQGK